MSARSTLSALAAAPLVACASAGMPCDEPLAAGDLSQVPIYYVGQKPQCAMARIAEVQAESEGGLRAAALRLGGNAVIGVRQRFVVPEPTRAVYRRGGGLAAVSRVYLGTAARLNDRCRI
jgi:hypothetical protein